ncbi:predicted protein [Postia placenta Mad-698-R]|uniref:Uncharacterized protein n=1 Tax=Postia placenta MAD-698-R-SB12 TaxID=670580 RepID=A0A1X6MKZ2_9APHY|nr:hypothetical protein POSPLADRAFT_1158293 [Postia placenta MAD-698-R-SB12]EED84615.1 predicted protein [Postia placenta Mad-698-R]OSX56906.1 hypothetical protein POSPLADRAFT_1158293 [Postia placenta MAD-698-R-SB12]
MRACEKRPSGFEEMGQGKGNRERWGVAGSKGAWRHTRESKLQQNIFKGLAATHTLSSSTIYVAPPIALSSRAAILPPASILTLRANSLAHRRSTRCPGQRRRASGTRHWAATSKSARPATANTTTTDADRAYNAARCCYFHRFEPSPRDALASVALPTARYMLCPLGLASRSRPTHPASHFGQRALLTALLEVAWRLFFCRRLRLQDRRSMVSATAKSQGPQRDERHSALEHPVVAIASRPCMCIGGEARWSHQPLFSCQTFFCTTKLTLSTKRSIATLCRSRPPVVRRLAAPAHAQTETPYDNGSQRARRVGRQRARTLGQRQAKKSAARVQHPCPARMRTHSGFARLNVVSRREARDAANLSVRLAACPLHSDDRGGRGSRTQGGQGGYVHGSMCPRCLSHRRPASSASGVLDATQHEGETRETRDRDEPSRPHPGGVRANEARGAQAPGAGGRDNVPGAGNTHGGAAGRRKAGEDASDAADTESPLARTSFGVQDVCSRATFRSGYAYRCSSVVFQVRVCDGAPVRDARADDHGRECTETADGTTFTAGVALDKQESSEDDCWRAEHGGAESQPGEPAKRATEGDKRQQRDADERGRGGQVQTGNVDLRGSGSACIRSAAANATRAAAAAWRRFRAWRSCAREERPPRAQLQLAPAQPSYHCPERPRARVREALSLRSSFSPSPAVPSVASFFPSLSAARARARCMRSAAATATACASGVASGVCGRGGVLGCGRCVQEGHGGLLGARALGGLRLEAVLISVRARRSGKRAEQAQTANEDFEDRGGSRLAAGATFHYVVAYRLRLAIFLYGTIQSTTS